MRVLIADRISDSGINILRQHAEVDIKLRLSQEELTSIIGDYEALIVRSQTQVTAKVIQAAAKLLVIGRAGVGIDNIDVDEATRHGIVVVNAPTGNTISAAEHAIALMMALTRHIPQANAVLRSGMWRRGDFMGTEVRGKTLGIIGLGKIGSEVAKRARGMEMKVVAHDPFVTVDYASKLNVTLLPLEQLLKEADFITLHIPLTATTKGYIGTSQLAMVKPTVQIINTARGGLIDEQALVTAIKAGKVAGAAIDVFSTEPTTESILFGDERIIVTPHLGASTDEAQAMAAIDIAEQVIDVFNRQPARYSVNAPFISPELLSVLAPYINMATLVGRLVSQLVEGQMRDIRIKYDGEIATYDTSALKAAVLGGLLEEISEERVNLVNANLVATQRGLIVAEQKKTDCENYASLVTVEVATSGGTVAIAGTVLRGESHVVRFNDYWIDIIPTGGYFLFSDHRDRPGLIGSVGKITGDADINISYMYLSRLQPRGQALMILALDEPISEEQRQQILSLNDVYTAKLVRL